MNKSLGWFTVYGEYRKHFWYAKVRKQPKKYPKKQILYKQKTNFMIL